MVGQLMIEDEYVINVKLRRPLREDGCLPPPVITITPDSPAVTLRPPPDTTFRHVRAAKSVNGAPPVVLGCTTVEEGDLGRPAQQLAPAGAAPGDRPAPRQLSIMPPPPPPPPAPPLRRGQEDLPAGQVTHGCLCLPLVQVYADDNTLVATNKFLAPAAPGPLEVWPALGVGGAPLALPQPSPPQQSLALPGAIYVPRIPAHCKSQSGLLYVPPVQEENLRAKRKEEPPAKGNSRRKKDGGGASSSSSGRGNQLVPVRSDSCRAAARALLTEVLGSRLATRPPSPRPTCLALGDAHRRPHPRGALSPTRNHLNQVPAAGSPSACDDDHPRNALAITFHDPGTAGGHPRCRGRDDASIGTNLGTATTADSA